MATVKIVLFKSRTYKNGKHPIMLRLTKNGKLKYFKLGDDRFNAIEKEWNAEFGLFKNDKRYRKEHVKLNAYISKKKSEAIKIIETFEDAKRQWTFKMFEQKFTVNTSLFFAYRFIENQIHVFRKNTQYSTATSLEETLSMLKKFDLEFERLYFQDIDYKYINRLHRYLKQELNYKDSSVGIVMRNIRSVLNKAIKQGIGSKETYPFSNIYGALEVYQISQLEKTKQKKFIPKEYLRKLLQVDQKEEHLTLAVKLFMFSFFSSGINFYDMALLKKSNIESEFDIEGNETHIIKFQRSKTSEGIKIPISLEVQQLLQYFELNYPLENGQLLPIITNYKLKDEKLHNHINGRRKRFNKHLKTVSQILKFPDNLVGFTFYHARHSYATTLLRKGKQVELIREALGHTDIKTTQTYLDSFGTKELALANEGLLN
ncbi:site-specific integrase [uncultured Draconibacterium sp.]|uniref:site-specific integrase n=1 Tax=uncultured Draconibacterium sp. TaxID=1573823 RepID=UPI0029C9A782|nr:site-specific integrase [uncultured Draconibacterium sp.]